MTKKFESQFIREQFPILETRVNGHPLIYFDNAATTQKPQSVIDTVQKVYTSQNGTLHRGAHYLSEQADKIYQELLRKLYSFFHANPSDYDIIITKNATEGINLFAHSFFYHTLIAKKQQSTKNTILISEQEHNSNLLPWLRLHNDFGAKVLTIPSKEDGTIDTILAKKMITLYRENLALVSVTHISNVIGKINEIGAIAESAHEWDIPVFVDGAQSAGHIPVSLDNLEVDAFVASGHKVYGPAGIGVLFVKKKIVERMSPFLLGGGMIESIRNNTFTPKDSVEKFMAGTQSIEAMAGLTASLNFLSDLGMEAISAYENELTTHFLDQIKNLPLTVVGGTSPENKIGLFSFISPVHPHDLGDLLNEKGIAVRAGTHCAHILHQKLDVSATTRVSFGIYNTTDEIDTFVEVLKEVISRYEAA